MTQTIFYPTAGHWSKFFLCCLFLAANRSFPLNNFDSELPISKFSQPETLASQSQNHNTINYVIKHAPYIHTVVLYVQHEFRLHKLKKHSNNNNKYTKLSIVNTQATWLRLMRSCVVCVQQSHGARDHLRCTNQRLRKCAKKRWIQCMTCTRYRYFVCVQINSIQIRCSILFSNICQATNCSNGGEVEKKWTLNK